MMDIFLLLWAILFLLLFLFIITVLGFLFLIFKISDMIKSVLNVSGFWGLVFDFMVIALIGSFAIALMVVTMGVE